MPNCLISHAFKIVTLLYKVKMITFAQQKLLMLICIYEEI